MKPAAFFLGLAAVVGGLTAHVLVARLSSGPLEAYASRREHPDEPRGDLMPPPFAPGVRRVPPDDRPMEEYTLPIDIGNTVEIIPPAPFDYASFAPDAIRHVRRAAAVATAIVIARTERIEGHFADAERRRVATTATATIRSVLKDISGRHLRAGDALSYRSGIDQMVLNRVHLILRMPWQRVPQSGRLYLTFLWQCGGSPELVEVPDAALEIRGTSVVPMLEPSPWTAGPAVPVHAVVDYLRRQTPAEAAPPDRSCAAPPFQPGASAR